jgi:hypothetical protein
MKNFVLNEDAKRERGWGWGLGAYPQAGEVLDPVPIGEGFWSA